MVQQQVVKELVLVLVLVLCFASPLASRVPHRRSGS